MPIITLLMCFGDRGVRGHSQKTRKNSMKFGKNAKNRLKIKEKAEIFWHKKIFKNEEISWKEELSHPCGNQSGPIFNT